MARKRMFRLDVLETDAFMDMPLTAQALYFHLNLRADDDGFIGNPNQVVRSIGASADDLKLLIAKRFVLIFEDGVIVIKHWRLHNTLSQNRYHETNFTEDKALLRIKDNKAYTFNEDFEPLSDGHLVEMSKRQTKDEQKTNADKVRLGKDSIDNNIYCREKEPDREENQIVKQVIDYLNEVTGSRYTCKNKTTNSNIKARVSEGHTLEDFKTVIDKKNAQWGRDPKMSKFLRPETLFCSKHFESYLNERITTNDTTRGIGANSISDAERDRQVDEILEHLNDDTDDIWD